MLHWKYLRTMRSFCLASSAFLFTLCSAQGGLTHYWDTWYLGFGVSRTFDGGVQPLSDPLTQPDNQADGTIVSDPVTGERLFSIHATGIFDRYAQPMPRSAELLFSNVVAILPHPGNTNVFYLFHMTGPAMGETLSYSIVDLSQNTGLGDLTGPSRIPLPGVVTWGEVAAISSPTGNTHWLVTHQLDNSNFVLYECNASVGLVTTPIFQSIGPIMNASTITPGGRMTVSSNNGRLAFSWALTNGVPAPGTWLFDVDPETATLSNPLGVVYYPTGFVNDIELSPDGNVLYISSLFTPDHQLVQFDLSNWDSLAVANSFYDVQNLEVPGNQVFSLRTGPDGRMYMVSAQSAWYEFNWWHLNHPDSLGAACDPDTTGGFMGNTDPAVFTLPWTFWPSMPPVGINESSASGGQTLHAWINGTGAITAVLHEPLDRRAPATICDATGRVVYSTSWPAGTSQLECGDRPLAAGTYCLRVADRVARFVVE